MHLRVCSVNYCALSYPSLTIEMKYCLQPLSILVREVINLFLVKSWCTLLIIFLGEFLDVEFLQ